MVSQVLLGYIRVTQVNQRVKNYKYCEQVSPKFLFQGLILNKTSAVAQNTALKLSANGPAKSENNERA